MFKAQKKKKKKKFWRERRHDRIRLGVSCFPIPALSTLGHLSFISVCFSPSCAEDWLEAPFTQERLAFLTLVCLTEGKAFRN
jgi:hypothetical protein